MDPTTEISRIAEERLKLIYANRERLVEAWIAETGLKPSESMLMEQTSEDGFSIRIWIERAENEYVVRLREAAPEMLKMLQAILGRLDLEEAFTKIGAPQPSVDWTVFGIRENIRSLVDSLEAAGEGRKK